MKKTMLCLLAIFVLFISENKIFAQENDYAVPAATQVVPAEEITSPRAADELDKKIARSFARQFKNTSEVSWNKTGDISVIRFMQDGVKMKCTYDENGKLIERYKYFTKEQVPSSVINLIRRNNFMDPVIQATEIKTNNSIATYVQLEDKDHIINLVVQENQVVMERPIRKN